MDRVEVEILAKPIDKWINKIHDNGVANQSKSTTQPAEAAGFVHLLQQWCQLVDEMAVFAVIDAGIPTVGFLAAYWLHHLSFSASNIKPQLLKSYDALNAFKLEQATKRS